MQHIPFSAIAHIVEMLFIIALVVWIAEYRKKIADMAKEYESKHIQLSAMICRIEHAYHADIEKIKGAVPEVKAVFEKEKFTTVGIMDRIRKAALDVVPIVWAIKNRDWETALKILHSKNNNTAMQKQILIVGTPGDPIFYVDNDTVKTANITEVHGTFDIVGSNDPVVVHNYVTDVQTVPELVGAKGNTPAQYLTLPVEQVFTSETDATASITAVAPKTLTPEQITEIEAYIKTTYGVDVTNIS